MARPRRRFSISCAAPVYPDVETTRLDLAPPSDLIGPESFTLTTSSMKSRPPLRKTVGLIRSNDWSACCKHFANELSNMRRHQTTAGGKDPCFVSTKCHKIKRLG